MIAIKRAKFTKMQLNLNVFQNNLFDLFEPCLERLEKKKKKKKSSAQQLNYFYVDFVDGKLTINQSDYGILISSSVD